MSIIKRIEALESVSKRQGGEHSPEEIWLIGVSTGGKKCCAGVWLKGNRNFNSATAEDLQRYNQHVGDGSNHG